MSNSEKLKEMIFDYDTVLNKLATAINEDYDWCRKTQVILENDNKLEDPATMGFLRGVEYVTSQLLDIIDERPIREDRPDDNICLCNMNIVGGNEDE